MPRPRQSRHGSVTANTPPEVEVCIPLPSQVGQTRGMVLAWLRSDVGARRGLEKDVNVGAIFRLAPGVLEPPAGLEGTVELIVEADGEAPERQFLVTLKGGHAEISEVGGAQPTASVRGSVAAWVRALGPEGFHGIAADLGPRRPGRSGARRLLTSPRPSRHGSRLVCTLTQQGGPHGLLRDALHTHDFVARCLTADDFHARS